MESPAGKEGRWLIGWYIESYTDFWLMVVEPDIDNETKIEIQIDFIDV